MADPKSLPRKPKTKRRRRKLPPNVFERDGNWYVKIRYRDDHGERHAAVRKCAKSPTDAREVREALQEELRQRGAESLRHSRHSLNELAKYYEDNYLIEAQYADDRKILGRRDVKGPKSKLKHLRTVIGDATQLRSMDYEFVRGVRIRLLKDPVVIEKWTKNEKGEKVKLPFSRPRSIIDVDRKMQLLRHMMRVAKRKKWIVVDPFEEAPETLITPGDEKRRTRVMQPDEEERLLACCDEDRDYLRLLIIGLTYTLTRSESEFFKLKVRDLDFAGGRVKVQQLNTKTLRARDAPLPQTFLEEAQAYIERHQLGPDDRLFPFSSVKRSWSTLKRAAGVEDLRIKDLRRTAATRLHRAGMPLGELSELLGHTTVEMTRRYIGVDKETTSRANELLDNLSRRAIAGTPQGKEDPQTVN